MPRTKIETYIFAIGLVSLLVLGVMIYEDLSMIQCETKTTFISEDMIVDTTSCVKR